MRKQKDTKIAVIGHLVWDRIIRADGQIIEAFGGTAYNIAALSSLGRASVLIYPICTIGEDLYERAIDYLKDLPGIDCSLIKAIRRPNEIHTLTYDGKGYRHEDNRYPMPILTKSLFGGCPDFDIALVNYIGGDEFPPRLLRWFKSEFKATVYLDFHSLALGRTAENHRFFRFHPHWRKYTSLADIVQMNYFELKTLFGEIEDGRSQIIAAAETILATGPEAVIITRESKDLIVVWREKRKIFSRTLPVPGVMPVVDQTGCGDSFAAGFVYRYAREHNIISACQEGLALAARKITFSGLDGFLSKI